jgi:hypothetical protein
MLRLRCITPSTMLVASLSKRVESRQVILHIDTVLVPVVIHEMYHVGVDFDPDHRDQPRSALLGHR